MTVMLWLSIVSRGKTKIFFSSRKISSMIQSIRSIACLSAVVLLVGVVLVEVITAAAATITITITITMTAEAMTADVVQSVIFSSLSSLS